MTKEELYHSFGPKLIDALTQIISDELNLIRVELSLAPRTEQQILDIIADKLGSIPDYVWAEK